MLVNHSGTVGDTPPSSSPAIPEQRNTTRYATYQRTTVRTSLNTSAQSRARIPHRPTPPDSRKPPSGIIDSVGANRMAIWPMSRNRPKFRVREKTTIAASRIAKYTSGTQPTGDPNADRGLPRAARPAGSAPRSARGAPCWRACRRRPADHADLRQAFQQPIAEAPNQAHPAHTETVLPRGSCCDDHDARDAVDPLDRPRPAPGFAPASSSVPE